MITRVFAVWVAVLAASFSTAAGAVSFSGIYAFGDSLTDTGNACSSPCPGYPVPPYYAGRFSNGPVWIEGVATGLSLSLSPSSTGGNNYAVGGATTGGVVGSEVPAYLSHVGGAADPTALYVLMAGGNDGLGGAVVAGTAASNMITAINDLKAAGAQYLLVSNLPDLALTPAALGNSNAYQSTVHQFSLDFNAALATGLSSVTGVTIFGLDLFAFLNDAVANPGSYGYTNVDSRCWDGFTYCADPSEYIFWDHIHPTSAAHGFLASAALLAIPEPGSCILVLTGLLVLASRRGRLLN